MNKNSLDVWVVMHIGGLVRKLYDNKIIPFDLPYDDIADLVADELSKSDWNKHRIEKMDNGADLPTLIEDWFTPRIIALAKINGIVEKSISVKNDNTFFLKVSGKWYFICEYGTIEELAKEDSRIKYLDNEENGAIIYTVDLYRK